jgi:hypothetical protein
MHPNRDRPQSFSREPAPASPNDQNRSSQPLDALYTSPLESLPDDRHRLAGSASGTGRSSGSLLDEAAATVTFSPAVDYRDPASLTEFARQYRERAERALALEEAAIEFNRAVHNAGVIRRRIERRQAALVRKAERTGRKDVRRANRPVRSSSIPQRGTR